MLTLTVVSLILTLVMTAVSTALMNRLRATERELERTQRRMARLDHLADKFAAVETDAAAVTMAPANESTEEPRIRYETPVQLPVVRADVRSAPVSQPLGLDFDSGSFFDDDMDFAAPRMTSEVTEDRRQKPSRPIHKTPVGSPRRNTPRSLESIVAVGSIQVRSDEVSRIPED